MVTRGRPLPRFMASGHQRLMILPSPVTIVVLQPSDVNNLIHKLGRCHNSYIYRTRCRYNKLQTYLSVYPTLLQRHSKQLYKYNCRVQLHWGRLPCTSYVHRLHAESCPPEAQPHNPKIQNRKLLNSIEKTLFVIVSHFCFFIFSS